jgi:hypothetical protein
MTMAERLEVGFSDDRPSLTAAADVNAALAEVGAGVWRLDLTGAHDDVRELLVQRAVTDAQLERLRTHFLLPRERLLEIIAAAGRTPNIPGGGQLSTFVTNEGYSYPQLWVVQGDADFARFERFHVNVSDDGVGVDEVLQILSGAGVVIRLRKPGGSILTLRLDCPKEGSGWLLTYDGGKPHIGSLAGATPGTKVLAQVIGPSRWAIRYDV